MPSTTTETLCETHAESVRRMTTDTLRTRIVFTATKGEPVKDSCVYLRGTGTVCPAQAYLYTVTSVVSHA